MEQFSVIVTALGATVLSLALISKRLERSPITPSMLALGIGVLLGPHLLGWINIAALGEEAVIRERAARLTLGIALMGVALRVPREFPRKQWRAIAVLVAPVMLLMWIISTVLIFVALDVTFWLAALLGAVIVSTDPVAASPIVTGTTAEENLPERIRHTISVESGANDGLAYLFVFLPFLMLTLPPEEALSEWLVRTLLWEVGVATVVGVLLGYGAGRLLRWADDRNHIESDWRLIYTVALALICIGAGRLIASDEVLVVFAAGLAFVQVVNENEREDEDRGQEAVNRFFSFPIFMLLGLTIPWSGWAALGWRGVALAAALMLLRRPPVLLLLRPFIGTLRGKSDALFVGWFGPVAVAAIYYASLMEHKLHEPLVWHVASLVICTSVLVHGVSGAPATRLFGRMTASKNS